MTVIDLPVHCSSLLVTLQLMRWTEYSLFVWQRASLPQLLQIDQLLTALRLPHRRHC